MSKRPAKVQAPAESVEIRPDAAGEFVEVITRIPNRKTRVTITVDIDPEGGVSIGTGAADGVADSAIRFALPADRPLPPLLFVTDEAALGRNIGPANARAAITAIRAGGHAVVNERLAGMGAMQAAAIVRPHLQNGLQGVVILGGGDVVPSVRLDVLGPDLRSRLRDPENDPDNFIVWSDEIYGDRDSDEIAELPVSRIADGRSARLVAAALASAGHMGKARFGIRNAARPFANVVYHDLPGDRTILVSAPTRGSEVRPVDVQSDFAYFMLHGDDSDARRFWGESAGSMLEAFAVDQVPAVFRGVVFAGCCWGALTTTRRALHFAPDQSAECRTLDQSIPLRFIAAGAQAFIGCTGVHYSPTTDEPINGGGPMHVAFFKRLLGGEPPARALFLAKDDCLSGLGSNTNPEELGIALKIIRQFTCLGLGW